MSLRHFLLLLLLTISTQLPAQPVIDEEKVKKAVVLMKKMMDNPDQMASVYADLEKLKLSSAENKEAQKRMQQQALDQVEAITQKSTAAAPRTASARMPQRLPVRDPKRLAAIPPTPTATTLKAHLQKLSTAVETVLPDVIKEESLQAWKILSEDSKDPREWGKGVAGLWMSGHAEHAAIVAGRACLADLSRAENLNNYAALLNMLNAQQQAIPLLQYLNQRYPHNPTILGNLGQAWFGLGEIPKAEKYLDSAIRYYPKHAQANKTKSVIQEEMGDMAGAAASLQASMDESYSEEKEARLRKLGYKETQPSWPLHIPQDPLGFNKFTLPEFPLDIKSCARLKATWDEHWKRMGAYENEFAEKAARLQAAAEDYDTKNLIKRMDAISKGGPIPEGIGPLSARATARLSYLLRDKDGSLSYKLRKSEAKLVLLGEELQKLDSIRNNAIDAVEKKYGCVDGEGGSGEASAACCAAINKITDEWLTNSNRLIKETYEEAIDLYKKLWNAQAYYAQYTMSEPAFEAVKANYKQLYASLMATVRPGFAYGSSYCDNIPKASVSKPGPLQHFDDVSCKYFSRLDFKFLVIESRCSRMTTSADLGKFKFSFTEDLARSKGIIPNVIIAGSADLDLDIGSKGLGSWGPVSAEAKAGVNLHIEVNEQGVSEVSATVDATVTVNTEVLDRAASIESLVMKGGKDYMKETGTTALIPVEGVEDKSVTIAGATATVSLNSGSSVSGSGVLSGLKL
jgi:tetratricopeptide (TPR) repeat protein